MHTNILNEKELHPNSVIKEYLTTAAQQADQMDNEDLFALEEGVKNRKKHNI